MVRELVHWFGQQSPPQPIAIGSQNGVCPQLHEHHVDLAARLSDVRAELATIDWSDPVLARHEAAALARHAHILGEQLALVSSSCG